MSSSNNILLYNSYVKSRSIVPALCLTVPQPSHVSVSRASSCPAVAIWTQTQPNLEQSKRSTHTYPDRVHPNQDNYPLWTEPKKNVTIKPSYIKGPLLNPPFSVCWRHCLQSPYPFHPPPPLFSRLIESLKGLHWPQHTLQLKWPFASLTCSGLQHEAFHLVSGSRPVTHLCPALSWP